MRIFEKTIKRMRSKLTLSMDKKIIDRSKKYAAAQNRSLSELVESYLKLITQDFDTTFITTDKIKRLQGSFKAPLSFDYKKIIREGKIRKQSKN